MTSAKKGAIRVEIDANFVNTKNNPKVIIPSDEVTWEIYKDGTDVVVCKNGDELYRWAFTGSLFVMGDEYCYYRHKDFQMLLDSFRIDKVQKIDSAKGKEQKVDVVCGVKELDKSFSIYCDGEVEIRKVADIRVGTPHQTKRFTCVIHNATWALVDTKNTRHEYRTMYCWDVSPHMKLKELNESGIGLPKFSSK